MSKIRLAGISALVLVTAGATLARAEDISTKKLSIKDNADAAKRQIQVSSSDLGVQFSDLGDPSVDGAAIHVYSASATDDFCLVLPGGPEWVLKKSVWKYSNKTTKNSAQVGDKKLAIKVKSGVTYSLLDDGMQGPVNAQVQFGVGTRYCMRCSVAKKNTGNSYHASKCAIAACDPEPSVCDSLGTTTSTSSSTSTSTSSSTSSSTSTTTSTSTTSSTSTTTSTTCPPPTGTVVKGSLTATPGRFNYNLMLGLPGANSACNTNFPGSHACTLAELQGAPASDLACLKDTSLTTVTSFWAIDGSAPALQQCNDDALGGSGLNWEYGTAHTASRGQKVPLTNGTGTLGALQPMLQCNFSGSSWVGCCL